MDEDDRELVGRLFAAATARLEDAVKHAVAGQSPKLGPPGIARHVIRLRMAVQDVAILAEAASIIARGDHADGSSREPLRSRRKRSTSP